MTALLRLLELESTAVCRRKYNKNELDESHKSSYFKILSAIPESKTAKVTVMHVFLVTNYRKDYYAFLFSEISVILSDSGPSSEASDMRKELVSGLAFKLHEMRPLIGKRSILDALEPLTRLKNTSDKVDSKKLPIITSDTEITRCISMINILLFYNPSTEFVTILLHVFRPLCLICELEEDTASSIEPKNTFSLIKSILLSSKVEDAVSVYFEEVIGRKSRVISSRNLTGGIQFVQRETPRYLSIRQLIIFSGRLDSQTWNRELIRQVFNSYDSKSGNPRFSSPELLLSKFDTLLADSPLEAFQFAKTIIFSHQKDQKILRLACSILSILLAEDPIMKDSVNTDEIDELLAVVKAFENNDDKELQNLSTMLVEGPASLTPFTNPQNAGFSKFQSALKVIKDPIVPIRAYGVKLLQTMIMEKDPFISENMEMVLEVLFQVSSDNDSFVYLNGVKTMAFAIALFPTLTLERIMEFYSDPGQLLDARLRIGESVMLAIQQFGKSFSKHSDLVCSSIFRVMQTDKELLPSCFSLLSYVVDMSPVSLVPSLSWLLTTIKDLMSLETSIPSRRAASNFLFALSKKIRDIHDLVPPDSTLRLVQILKRVYEFDPDDACKQFVEAALNSLDYTL
ncbi:transmembrane and coiled-coil domains-containing protein 7 [Dinochytrium kinnereticum]|nr:transmembrane and coiled-coil domains-containing protein 7 [Dinochytrium kinnereticum]